MNADLAMQRALDRLRRVGVAGLTAEERNLAAIWSFEAGVSNGGFAHFFGSAAGDLAAAAPAAFRVIGALARAEIAEKANAVFGPGGVPADRASREQALRSLPASARNTFDRLEAQYFELSTDLEDRLEEYLSAHGAAKS